jgi:hypothetical protein
MDALFHRATSYSLTYRGKPHSVPDTPAKATGFAARRMTHGRMTDFAGVGAYNL